MEGKATKANVSESQSDSTEIQMHVAQFETVQRACDQVMGL